MLKDFFRRFWLPPRAHGEIIEDRTVSFLELFYDLVYVVVIGRAAHHLAEHVSWRGVFEFVVVFGLIWIAWMNGTLFYELHGREDGRTRVFVFIQMLILALLAVYTGEAPGEGGVGFAVTYVLFLLVLTWLWYSVRRLDAEEYMAATARYLWGMGVTIVLVGSSAFLSADTRMLVWAGVVAMWIVVMLVVARQPEMGTGLIVTESLVERYGLFVIIVLGEVVVGVVQGLSEAERNAEVIATGLFGLSIGFAYWWTYFDYVGRRAPAPNPLTRVRWLLAHLPVTAAIAAAGAAMVSLIEHGTDASTPTATAWLLSGAVAFGLVALVITMSTLQNFVQERELFVPVSIALLVAAAVALSIGWLAPTPWLLAALLVLTLLAVWFYAVVRLFQVRAAAGEVAAQE